MSSIWGHSFGKYGQLVHAYESFNYHGQGHAKGHSNRKEFYVNSVLFMNCNSPAERFVRTPDNKLVKLTRTSNVGVIYENHAFSIKKTVIPVPDIGVYSRFNGDTIPLEELHGRLQFLFLEQAANYFDEYVDGMTAPGIITMQKRDNSPSNRLQLHYDRWNAYSNMFHLNWPELPDEFMIKVLDYEDAKVGKYTDPANIKKRETSRTRAKARKEAKHAFGV